MPDFDLAWLQDGQRVVVEVKSLTVENETSQLRMGLGQVLQYRHALKVFGEVRAVPALERRPIDPTWESRLCGELGVVLTWAPDFPGLFVLKTTANRDVPPFGGRTISNFVSGAGSNTRRTDPHRASRRWSPSVVEPAPARDAELAAGRDPTVPRVVASRHAGRSPTPTEITIGLI
jgi:hypothetical protein